ncbi:hypothetical protein ACIQXD_29580 [Streptomyces uncialis]|uniref:hypothetical protein n=1 Tax=Streptomyces uncialis TaxID=1048205 RepID=UPI003813711A
MNLYVSALRTVVPWLAGLLITEAAALGLDLDPGAAEHAVTLGVVVAYYTLFRWAEQRLSPRFGWLLGYAKPPSYEVSTGKD